MHPLTLQFRSRTLEDKYTLYAKPDDVSLYLQNQILMVLITIFGSLYSFGMQNIPVGCGVSIISIVLTTQYHLVKRYHQLLEPSVCLNLVAFLLTQPVIYTIQLAYGIFYDIDTFLVGQGYTFLFLSYGRYSQFHHKAASIIVNLFVQLFIKLIILQQFSISTLLWVVGTFMIILSIYQADKVRRQKFLSVVNETKWQSQLEQIGDISIISCTCEYQQIRLQFDSCNRIATRKFSIQDQSSFQTFVRNLKVVNKKVIKEKITYSDKRKFGSSCVNLEQMLYNNLQLEESDSDNSYFGMNGNILYVIHQFSTWNEKALVYHVLLKETAFQFSQEEILLEQKEAVEVLSNYRNSISSNLYGMYQHMLQDQRQTIEMGNMMEMFRSHQNLNIQLSDSFKQFKQLVTRQNIPESIPLKFKFVDSCDKKIMLEQLSKIFSDTISMIKISPYYQRKKKFIHLSYRMETNLFVRTDKRLLYLLLLNLILLIVKSAQKTGQIKLIVQSFQIHKVGVILVVLQSTLIPDKIREETEFKVSQFLVFQMGPFKDIQFKVESDQRTLKFLIFADINDVHSEIPSSAVVPQQ